MNQKLFKLFFAGAGFSGAVAFGALLAAKNLPLAAHKSEFSSTSGKWVVSSDPGPTLPPIGRSLFDHLTSVEAGGGKKSQVIPYPFSNLIASIRTKLRPEAQAGGAGVRGVLIPLGRSLQRSASKPDFFRFPRAVIGVDGIPVQSASGSGMHLKDRLFVGFNEKAAALEVISYNEAAGRFEFQVVHDYREGGKPKAVYARRAVCLSCHQNAAPIFSDQPWQETNAHAEMQARLRSALTGAPASAFDGQKYMGLPIAVPESEPLGIDNAKFRANLIPATQFLWQRLCEGVDSSVEGSARCRARALALAMRMGFSNLLNEDSAFFYMRDVQESLAMLASGWQKLWPGGLLISSPRIPNRNPFEKPKDPNPFDVKSLEPKVADALADLIKSSNIPADLEPLNRREALDRWQAGRNDISGLANWLRQMASFLTEFDWKRIDHWSSRAAAAAGQRVLVKSVCAANASATNKISFECEPGPESLRLNGYISWTAEGRVTGAIESLAAKVTETCDAALGAEAQVCPTATNLTILGELAKEGEGLTAKMRAANRINILRSRLSDGNLIEGIAFKWTAASASQIEVTVAVLKDFAFIERALERAVKETVSGQANLFAKRPLRRTAVLAAIRKGLNVAAPAANECCENDDGMPAPQAEEGGTVIDQQLVNIAGSAAPFIKECSTCHQNSNGFPPNFLSGSLEQVRKQLSNCAERIWFRIHLYERPADQRSQAPMPPVAYLNSLQSNEGQWRQGPAYRSLKEAASTIFKEKGQSPPDLSTADYNALPPCLGNSF